MDDSLNSGADNKLPLFIGIGAIAVALLALLFAVKARNDAKGVTAELEAIKASYATKAELAESANAAAKTADIQAVDQKFEEFRAAVTTNFNTLATSVNEQGKLITGLTKGGKVAASGVAKPGAPVAGAGEYSIKAGDTFRKIAAASGVSVADLSKANPGVDSSKLKIGQIIKLPAKK